MQEEVYFRQTTVVANLEDRIQRSVRKCIEENKKKIDGLKFYTNFHHQCVTREECTYLKIINNVRKQNI